MVKKRKKLKKAPKEKGVPKKYLSGTSGKFRSARAAAIRKRNKNYKGEGALPGDLDSKGRYKGGAKKSIHTARFKRMYG
jgi:hypothetical protein